ncbi:MULTISPECIES: phosphonate metabolism transcriptional regulator PhnF [unclassified Mesorhizobium]|uniref:phosphonate metabolism transcriptional regulator PhnF n=2 Tax=Mesorhizobium TaxID=68287 RepID=UPI000FD32462|nr:MULTISPECIES: phosphonate metabolism transcriptional regulator PhnF [unclassified Mesorhizobium]RVD59546.1 phosphonate metabolism transcriptional regulator PhnF [Mesorhizobium sp. M8A.F.Ca.ET.023.02.2.1]RWC73813.1 MAG: phosphonate metabolism transcriptional regulator PhnF [Mesorhizobium sp.]TGT91361.1 phosphonate metabolism transcriptional regulator PhnF [Mesorhizobium sp. M8A.F.Ca.ET.161.01.1.1]TGV43362.1 phosphonate metabolism transcriptional regulator PhnF [Mesorhizobium sp. M8A.F.Ca.ET.1
MIGQQAADSIERRSGVSLWRQIADRILQAIAIGDVAENAALPPEVALAERYGVNRHTVRSAISALVQEGVLRAEQGRGTFVLSRKRLSYPIGARTRFSAGLQGQTSERHIVLLSSSIEPASQRVAEGLGLARGADVMRLETRGEADGRSVSRAASWFDARRFAGIDEAMAQTGSITASLARFGIDDYLRQSTVLSARHADAADLADLDLQPGAIVLVTVAVNVTPDGQPIQFSESRFPAERVELKLSAL